MNIKQKEQFNKVLSWVIIISISITVSFGILLGATKAADIFKDAVMQQITEK